jgi:Dynamin family
MEEFNFSNLTEAANYARRGSNSSVLKKVEYYCYHPLLKDGNVLVDMPGIDAPVKKDAELTYRKVEHPDTSAVICVLKAASAGEMSSEETELLEKMRSNLGIRDRVFYVFNRIDQTWYVPQLRQRLDNLIATQFQHNQRLYKTSGLLGFYGSQILQTNTSDRFGLDSLFAESLKGVGGQEETPYFVSEFNSYCAGGKLNNTDFRVSVNGFETPNDNYVRILNEWGQPLIKKLISDSGIEEFRNAITRYLTEEKRPQLFITLAKDLQPLCQKIQKYYLHQLNDLASQPNEIEAMKSHELANLHQQLLKVGTELAQHLEEEANLIVTNSDKEFEEDFQQLKAKMVSRLDELLQTFSVEKAYSAATLSHPRNATAPLLAILVEALYYIANELEDVLVATSEELIKNFCSRLSDRIKNQEYYRQLYRLLNNDNNLDTKIQKLEQQLTHTLVSAARTECDRYVRESPRFYDENTFSIYQFRQTLQQTSQGYDCASMLKAEPAIRQLLKLDIEPKLSTTISRNFRHTINNILKTQLLPIAKQEGEEILQQFPQAKANLEQILEQEAMNKIARNQQLKNDIEQKIKQYNLAVSDINGCLSAMQLFDYLLPTIVTPEVHEDLPSLDFSDDSNGYHNNSESLVNMTNY